MDDANHSPPARRDMPYRLPATVLLLLVPLGLPAADGASEQGGQTSTLHISRPKYFINGGIKPGIVIDGEEYPALPNGACMTIELTPGTHALSLKFSDRYNEAAPRPFTLEAGGKAYAQVVTGMEDVDEYTFRRLFSVTMVEPPPHGTEIACSRQIDPKDGKKHRKSIWMRN